MRISQKNVYSRWPQGHQTSSPEGPQTAVRIRFFFPKSLRILKRKSFKDIAQKNRRFVGKCLVISYAEGPISKIGLTVPKQFGKAHRRNRFKRLVREAFRLNQHEMPPLEMIIFPNREVKNFSFDEIVLDFLTLRNHYAQCPAKKSR